MNNPRSERLLLGITASPGWPRATRHAPSRVTTGRHESAPSTLASSFVNDEALFLASLPVIDDVTAQICRRHRLIATEAEDFRSEVRLHFIDRNYAVLRGFEGRSSLSTYVIVVIQRLFLDYRNRLWGKWRPSADARRLGPTGILVERLVVRDGWSFDQVVESLRVNHGIDLDEALYALCVKAAKRGPARQFVAEEEAGAVESSGPAPDVNVVRAEQDFLAKRVQSALDRARQALEPEERLILKMRFEDATPIADIARALHLNQKRLYRTVERLLTRIGASLEAEGISRAEVTALFAEGIPDWTREHDGSTDAAPGTAVHPGEPARTSWRQK
jgi:RNA polymerase sigma factor (sigma-70 family)